ncbi:MAG: tRNA uridine-5-carboxymethylaminomethyl(34) synthesis enzyme MnmG, partial [Clostridia bacterium]|nr:tRNA uridine-5-carboxymethylaminomethyl(34) synthesis enzyme MnmG [Clostridia bacterium]
MTYRTQTAVIGAGHAGLEAALASSRMGIDTVLFTINLDSLGNMPCNPSIGGTGKGHLVFEIDALGGEMGRAADYVTLQSRTLNTGKGPAVRSKRVQADRLLYRTRMKNAVEKTENLRLVQAEVTEILVSDGSVKGLKTSLGAEWEAEKIIIATGTYLNGRVVVGSTAYSSGPDGMLPSLGLSDSLRKLGIELMRFKTGTPPRIHRRSVDLTVLEKQDGEESITPFSADTDTEKLNSITQIPCYTAYTNTHTHEIIKNNLHRSPLFSGVIQGTGPRYCPSIEDKVVRVSGKERHQLFLEPMGADTDEMYLQGFSSSLPEDVQTEMLHSIKGFEHAEIMRNAYAIEYDCCDPLQLYPTLEFKKIKGLYGAGQFNGTSGYEEAAAQGLIAGINSALSLQGREPLILTRDSSYIGTLIDDLVTKGTNEPYRIMTSRSEYRLLLRQDNAQDRLIEYGRYAGLVSDERYTRYLKKKKMIQDEIERLKNTTASISDGLNDLLLSKGSAVTDEG